MAEAISFIFQVRLNGIQTLWMISQSEQQANRELLPLMDILHQGGLMYLELLDISTDKDLQTHASAHLTSSNEWDQPVLDNVHTQRIMGSLIGLMIQLKGFNLIQTLLYLIIIVVPPKIIIVVPPTLES